MSAVQQSQLPHLPGKSQDLISLPNFKMHFSRQYTRAKIANNISRRFCSTQWMRTLEKQRFGWT